MKAVGARLPRYDGVAHVTGRTVFVDDVRVQGTLCVKALRSPLDNAGILKLDTKKAEIEGLLTPVRTMLDQYRGELLKSEKVRIEAYGGLQEQIRTLLTAQEAADRLVTAANRAGVLTLSGFLRRGVLIAEFLRGTW